MVNKDNDKVSNQARELYDNYTYGNFSYGKQRERYDPLLFDFLKKPNKDSTLYDIGCGTGFWMDAYINNNVSKDNIVAVDITPRNIMELRNRGFKALCGNVNHLPFSNNVSDFTICQGVIHHTANPFQAFKELVRITKHGGHIYLNVYNRWNPYFYIVHKATYPIRYLYWNISKKIIDIFYPVSKIIFQPIAYLLFGQFLDDKTGKTMFMDQIITPRAHLFSKSILMKYAERCNCEIQEFKYNRHHLMLAAILKVNK